MMATASENTIGNAREGAIMQRISWSGILTGVVAGLIIQVALLVLGLAVGLVSITNLENLGGSIGKGNGDLTHRPSRIGPT